MEPEEDEQTRSDSKWCRQNCVKISVR